MINKRQNHFVTRNEKHIDVKRFAIQCESFSLLILLKNFSPVLMKEEKRRNELHKSKRKNERKKEKERKKTEHSNNAKIQKM